LQFLLLLWLITGCAPGAGVRDEGGWRGTVLPQPLDKVSFTLTDTQGRPFDFRRETDGRVTLLFFGYTNCPDVCPVHLANLGTVLRRFPYDVRSRVRVVFVTTDPARDTPEMMRAWLDRFDRDFVGLRGDSAEVARIQAELSLAPAARGPAGEDGRYAVGHAAQIIAYTADDRAHVVYPFGTRQEDWLSDIPRLLDAKW
jgi:protein SCO1/2